MRRLFWVAVGATATVVVVARARRGLHAVSPAGAAERVEGAASDLATRARLVPAAFRAARAEREAALYDALVGDADVEATRAERRESRSRRGRNSAAGRGGFVYDDDGWPQDRPDDDGELPYSFF